MPQKNNISRYEYFIYCQETLSGGSWNHTHTCSCAPISNDSMEGAHDYTLPWRRQKEPHATIANILCDACYGCHIISISSTIWRYMSMSKHIMRRMLRISYYFNTFDQLKIYVHIMIVNTLADSTEVRLQCVVIGCTWACENEGQYWYMQTERKRTRHRIN